MKVRSDESGDVRRWGGGFDTVPGARLYTEQESARVFDRVLDSVEECDGFLAINQAVVIAESQVHHGSNHDLTLHDNGSLCDIV